MCDRSGDLIQYLRDYRSMNFGEACRYIGRMPVHSSREPRTRSVYTGEWRPREAIQPDDKWQRNARSLVDNSAKLLWTARGAKALAWLKNRGLREETIRTYCLGWNGRDLYVSRTAWGLSEINLPNGGKKQLFIPEGLIIPKCAGQSVERIRIRRFKPSNGSRYYLLPGSARNPLILTGGAACLIVESDLDAFLMHQEVGDLVTVMALGSVNYRPDVKAARTLDESEAILVALDHDDAGGNQYWNWWLENYPNSMRWPPLHGKDPSEAMANGSNLRTWTKAGLKNYWGERIAILYRSYAKTLPPGTINRLYRMPAWRTEINKLKQDFQASHSNGQSCSKQVHRIMDHWENGLREIGVPGIEDIVI